MKGQNSLPRRYLSFVWYWVRRLFFTLKYRGLIIRKNTSDFKAFEQIFLFKEYLIDIPFTPKVIVDAGANAGYASIYFSNKFPNAQIIAIEPEESNFCVLESNIEKYKNITTIKKGLWHEKTQLFIDDPNSNKWSFELTTELRAHGIKMPTITANEIIEEYGQVDIFKIDIEGAEKELFSKNINWIKQVKIIIVETHDFLKEGCSNVVFEALPNSEFKHFKHGENEVFVRKQP
ncbi:MAG: hypothetical protein COA32_01455 [Fluviicola sp.]|nr:MAG: hypothetical protein COA32_01455 [Fluviicola sp.]